VAFCRCKEALVGVHRSGPARPQTLPASRPATLWYLLYERYPSRPIGMGCQVPMGSSQMLLDVVDRRRIEGPYSNQMIHNHSKPRHRKVASASRTSYVWSSQYSVREDASKGHFPPFSLSSARSHLPSDLAYPPPLVAEANVDLASTRHQCPSGHSQIQC
jgi:hypothetical protein